MEKIINKIKLEAGNKPYGIIYPTDNTIRYQIQGQEVKEIEI